MSHITLTKQWDSMYIQVSSSLHHYTTDEVHGLNRALLKCGLWTCGTGLWGDPTLLEVVHDSYILRKLWDIISLPVSSYMVNYTTHEFNG
jgi:hypothetical protein